MITPALPHPPMTGPWATPNVGPLAAVGAAGYVGWQIGGAIGNNIETFTATIAGRLAGYFGCS